MPGKWDTSTKRLIGENPEHFVRWLLPEAQFQDKAKRKTPGLNTGEIEADNLYEIILFGKPCLVHIEFQSYSDATIPRRMWEYNALATFTYKVPTLSFVIYLKKCKAPESSYSWIFPTGEKVHAFEFKVVELWKIRPEVLKQTGLVGIYPLMVLAQDGKQPAIVEEVITGLEAVSGNTAKELLSITYILASLVFEQPADRTWLKRRFHMLRDVLRDTWAYQEIMQEGREEGRQLGLQEGRQEGRQLGLQEGRQEGLEAERQQRLQDQRQILMTLVQTRFASLASLAKKHADDVQDPEVLQKLVLQVLTMQDEDQVKRAILSMGGGKTSSKKKKK